MTTHSITEVILKHIMLQITSKIYTKNKKNLNEILKLHAAILLLVVWMPLLFWNDIAFVCSSDWSKVTSMLLGTSSRAERPQHKNKEAKILTGRKD